jgi:hypothetical protein
LQNEKTVCCRSPGISDESSGFEDDLRTLRPFSHMRDASATEMRREITINSANIARDANSACRAELIRPTAIIGDLDGSPV